MAITLTSGGTTITLPEDLQWVDEYQPWAVSQVQEFSLTGALIIHESARLAGRPITLQSGSDFGWITRAVADQLRTLSETAPGPLMTLSLPAYPSGTRTFSVRFRRDQPCIEAAPIKHKTPPAPTDYYSLVLRLMVVA